MTNSIKIELEVDSTGAVRSINGVTKAVTTMATKGTKDVGKLDGAMNKLNGSMGNFVSYLGAMGTAKALAFVSQGFKSAINGAIQFENAIAEINTLLPKNEKLTARTTDAFRELSSSYGKDATTEAKAFYQIVSAGIKGTAEQMDVLTQSNEASIAGLTDVATSADVLTSVMNAYSGSSLTAGEASDKLFVAVREGKTTFGELAGAIGQVAPIAYNANLSFGELTGTLAQVTKNGISTSEATTGLKAILTGIIKPSEQASKSAKDMGLQFDINAIKTKGWAGFLKDLKDKTNGETEALAKLFPNVRALGPILGIVSGDFEGFEKVLNATENSLGATSDASKIMKETMKFKLDQATQEVKNFSEAFLGSLAPQILLVSKYWANFLNQLGSDDAIKGSGKSIAELNKEIEQTENILKSTRANIEKQSKGENWFTETIGTVDRLKKGLEETNARNIQLVNERRVLLKAQSEEEDRLRSDKETKDIVAMQREFDREAQGLETKVEAKAIEYQTLDELKQAQISKNNEDLNVQTMHEQMENDARYQYLVATLGKQTASRKVYAISQMKDEKKRVEALKKLYTSADKQAIKQADETAKAKMMLEQKQANAKLALASATAGLLTALLGRENKVAFAIEKAVAIASIIVQTQMASAKAVGQLGIFGLSMATAIQVTGAMQVATVAATAIKGFQEGGIYTGGSNHGDQNIARVNNKEMILTQRQQANLFDQANGAGGGGGTTNIFNIGEFVSDDQNTDKLIDAINDRIEFGNKQLNT